LPDVDLAVARAAKTGRTTGGITCHFAQLVLTQADRKVSGAIETLDE